MFAYLKTSFSHTSNGWAFYLSFEKRVLFLSSPHCERRHDVADLKNNSIALHEVPPIALSAYCSATQQ